MYTIYFVETLLYNCITKFKTASKGVKIMKDIKLTHPLNIDVAKLASYFPQWNYRGPFVNTFGENETSEYIVDQKRRCCIFKFDGKTDAGFTTFGSDCSPEELDSVLLLPQLPPELSMLIKIALKDADLKVPAVAQIAQREPATMTIAFKAAKHKGPAVSGKRIGMGAQYRFDETLCGFDPVPVAITDDEIAKQFAELGATVAKKLTEMGIPFSLEHHNTGIKTVFSKDEIERVKEGLKALSFAPGVPVQVTEVNGHGCVDIDIMVMTAFLGGDLMERPKGFNLEKLRALDLQEEKKRQQCGSSFR